VRGKEAVAARVAIALGTRLGDWFGDLGAGVDEALVRGRLAFLGEAEREFARVAQAQSGVQSVTVSRVSYDPRTRDGEYSVEIELDPANGGGSVVVAAALSP
jgi:hypothetical protein